MARAPSPAPWAWQIRAEEQMALAIRADRSINISKLGVRKVGAHLRITDMDLEAQEL